MITDIDQAADVLGADLRSIWRQVADILPQNGGHRLVGGTALAVHLRHRQSFDLDFLSTRPFDGHLLATPFILIFSEISFESIRNIPNNRFPERARSWWNHVDSVLP